MACGAAPALAESSPHDLAAYVRARAADADGDAGAAAAGYSVALAASPGNAVIAIRAYRVAIASGDYALLTQARVTMEKADLAPADSAVLALAEAVHAGDGAATQAAINRVAAGPLDFLAPSLRAWAALDDPKIAFAALDVAGTNPIARRYAQENRALILIATGQTDEGVALLQVLLGADRGNFDLRINAAGLLVAGDRADTAARLLASTDKRLIGIAKGSQYALAPTTASGMSRIFTRLAADLAGSQSARLGLAIARAALRLDPANERAKLLLAAAIGQDGNSSDALAVIGAIRADSPYHAQAEALRIDLLDKSGREAAAIAAAAGAAKSSSADAAALRRYADLLAAADRFEAAAQVYRRVLDADAAGADWVLYLQLGSALEQADHWPQARAALEKAVELAPNQPVALNYLGYSLLEHGGSTAAARRLLEHASSLKPGDLAILDSLAWAYFVDGETAKALPLLEKAAMGEPANLTINEHLGDAYWRAGRRYEARYAWRAAAGVADPADRQRLASKIADGPQAR